MIGGEMMNEYQLKEKYCIVGETLMIRPVHNKMGYPFSIVAEGQELFAVKLSPLKIIEYTLLQYGTSLNGALKAARHHLGRGYMQPVLLCQKEGIIWFPDSSFKNPNCSWFANHQIKETRKKGIKLVIVFNNNWTYEHKMGERYFNNKRQTALDYHSLLHDARHIQSHLSHDDFRFCIAEEAKKIYTDLRFEDLL